MDLHYKTKINKLLQSWPSGTVGVTAWLEEMGVSRQLERRYVQTGWLERIGRGALKRAGDTIDWQGGLYAVQKQASLDIHVGARTALGLQGQEHYLELNAKTAQLFASNGTSLPHWFRAYDWGIIPQLHHTDFLPPGIGLVDIEHKLFAVKASGAARALMECLYLSPEGFELAEAYQIMEGLATLRPVIVQALLEKCASVKVIRLFLFMAEKAGHPWLRHLDLAKVDLGKGKRSFATGGVYAPKYQITVPQELATL
jgi:hypothetical protein